ncbi:hypothetical protein M3Y94_01026600 [Aphelenchoides besseyi]|nr:hypothetical protein M3Y94_01026600 [Aphelenchoides besseyi]
MMLCKVFTGEFTGSKDEWREELADFLEKSKPIVVLIIKKILAKLSEDDPSNSPPGDNAQLNVQFVMKMVVAETYNYNLIIQKLLHQHVVIPQTTISVAEVVGTAAAGVGIVAGVAVTAKLAVKTVKLAVTEFQPLLNLAQML